MSELIEPRKAALAPSDETALSPEARLDRIEAEFEAIRARHRARLGAEDVAYIRRMRRNSRVAEFAGRGLLWFGRGPLSFIAGTGLVWLHRNLEAIEIGHNVLHGQYDYFPEIPEFHAHNFKWKAPIDEEGWRREHNAMHHVHTNVYEKDPDLNHGLLRTNDRTPWNPAHRWQVPLYAFGVYPTMLYRFNGQNLGFAQEYRAEAFPTGNEGYAMVDTGGLSLEERQKRNSRSINRVLFKEYGVFPALALLTGRSPLRVLAGNAIADMVNNYWIGLTIQATHFTEPLQPEDAVDHKGRWYLSQLDSSVNFKGSRRMSILWGHLNYQIEHHLFPDIPSHRYPDMAKEVKAVCAKYGIAYKCNESWGQAIRNYVKVMWKYSFPNKPERQDA